MTRITVAPAWEWGLVWYFFLSGLAGAHPLVLCK